MSMVLGKLGGGLMIVAIVGFLWLQNDLKSKQIGNLRGQVAGLNAEIEYQNRISKLNADHNAAQAEAVKRINSERQIYEQKINQMRLSASADALKDPFGFGDDMHKHYARVMCRIERATDPYAQPACDYFTTETTAPDIAHTITVTADIAERWRELCQDGQKDFCDWSITGFTPQGVLNHISWLNSIDAYVSATARWMGTVESMVDVLQSEK